jgi:hypothetical protein
VTVLERDDHETRAVDHGAGRMVDAIGSPVDLWLGSGASWAPMNLCRVLSVEIHTGRDNASTPVCEPMSLSAEVIDPTGTVSRSTILHRPIAVTVSPAAVAYWGLPRPHTLFIGSIAEVTVRSDPALGTVLTITASSHLADLGRTYVGDTPWAQEKATVRAARILSAVGYASTLYGGQFDPAVLARDVDRQPALDLVAALAVEALFDVTDWVGNVAAWSDLSPTMTWASVPPEVSWSSFPTYVPPSVKAGPTTGPQALLVASTWREAYAATAAAAAPGAYANLVLSACELLSSWSAAYTYAGMVNRLTLRYGPTPDGGSQPEKVYTAQASINAYGLLESSLSTDLATVADADAMAGHLFASASLSKPTLPALVFDLWRTASKATGTAFLTSGNRVLSAFWWIPDLPETLPVNPHGYLWLEGIHHRITPDGWAIEAAVSDPWPYGNAWQWVQLPPATSWATTPPAVTWATVNDWANANLTPA